MLLIVFIVANTSITRQKITTDTIEFKYYEYDSKGPPHKKLYLNPFFDIYNSEIISFSISRYLTYSTIKVVLNQVIEKTTDYPFRRTFHSDQGRAYQMEDFISTLEEDENFQCMSRKGNCLDNAIMENFFRILK